MALGWLARGRAEAPLLAAARAGDTLALESLLQAGADPDLPGKHGRTALHEAVLGGHVEAAACLLAYGVGPNIIDGKGLIALDPARISLQEQHAIRQRYHRWRLPASEQPVVDPVVAGWVEQLEERGIVKVSGLVGGDELAQMQADAESFVVNLEHRRAAGECPGLHYDEEEYFWEPDLAHITNNAFKYSTEFGRFCCREEIVSAADLYFGKPANIQRGLAMRYLPSPPSDNAMFGWHHDMEEKRFKLMLLLTDVSLADQHMSYVLGSHHLLHPYEMFLSNKCSLEYCREHMGDELDIYEATGQAGDFFIFDSNGSHRGNRRETASVRDVLLVEVSADPSLTWGGDIAPELLPDGSRRRNPFEVMASVQKKWELPVMRTLPAWAENLPHPERWLVHRDAVRSHVAAAH